MGNKDISHGGKESSSEVSHRRRSVLILLLIVLLGFGVWWAWWYFVGRWWVVVDDAYVEGNIYPITARVDGTVAAVKGYNTYFAKKGEAIVLLRGQRTLIGLRQAQARLAQAQADARALMAEIHSKQAKVAALQAALQTANQKAWRYAAAAQSGAIEKLGSISAKNDVLRLRSDIAAENASMHALQARLDTNNPNDAPSVRVAREQLRHAELEWQRRKICTPVSGYLAQQSVQQGQWVKAGMKLFTIVPLDQIWVDANIKETQLARVEVGDRVTLHADMYGSEISYHGWVAGIGAGSGAVFAVLPPENASGNWIKFTQRVPVRIAIEPKDLDAHPIRPGLTMSAAIRIGGKRISQPLPHWMEPATTSGKTSALTDTCAK